MFACLGWWFNAHDLLFVAMWKTAFVLSLAANLYEVAVTEAKLSIPYWWPSDDILHLPIWLALQYLAV